MRHDESITDSHYVREVVLLRKEVPSFDRYPFDLPAVRNLHRLPLHPRVTFLIGENGSGKSTLLEAIAVRWGFNPEGGSRNFRFTTRASHSELADFIGLVKGPKPPVDGFFLRAESYFNLGTAIENLDDDEENARAGPAIIGYYGGRSLREQSHGESFFALFMHRFGGRGLYLLDEPEAALSPMRQMTFITRMHWLVKARCQFIIATHSPIIMAYPDASIIQLTEDGLSEVQYEDTEHHFITRQFLNRREQMLKVLMDETVE
jgi:predicted ATPase